jgi:DNA-directed RNA polymerase specialized sigma24 family protein
MAPLGKATEKVETHGGEFASTHWSVVLAAGQQESPSAAEALEKLCRTYWYPLYVYVRRRGHSVEDAQELTQQFFAHLLQNRHFRMADPGRGRFRTFLLHGLEHFLINEWKRAHRLKRGGGMPSLSLDAEDASTSYARIGERLGMAEGAARGAMHRLRERYRERLHTEVAQTVAHADDVEEELRYLIAVVSQRE